jgi:integrase
MRPEKNSIRLGKGLRLFRTTYNNEGKRRFAADWYIEFRDHTGKPRRIPAFSDKGQSAELAHKVQKLVNWKVNGELPDTALSRWIETVPDKLRDRLARIGLLDSRRVAAGKPLADHLDDWKAALEAKGNTPRHAELVVSRARKAIEGCNFRSWQDISASKVQNYLATLRSDKKDEKGNIIKRGISAQTFNFYLQSIKQFCRWMVRDGRAVESPVMHLDGLNVKTDRRHDRRPLSADELRFLLTITENGPDRAGMTGKERAMLYRLAAETGLRAGELRSLTRNSFNLDEKAPTVTIDAAYAKNRRRDTLQLKQTTTDELKTFFEGKMPGAMAFRMPERRDLIHMYRADLSAARNAAIQQAPMPEERQRIQQSSFCLYRDGAGHVADFHALRHAFISNLVAGGVHPKTAQAMARHSTITLTMDRYSHADRPAMSEALHALPDLSTKKNQALAATGTTGIVDPAIPQNSIQKNLACFLAHFDGITGDERQQDGTAIVVKTPDNPMKNAKIKAGRGIRTPGSFSTPPVYKTGAFDHSAIPAASRRSRLSEHATTVQSPES